MKRYNNYHKHTHYSNLSTLDSCSKPIDYIKRAKELGQDLYFTTEHGWQGNIFEAFELCRDNNIKPIYGVEAYYVDDSSIKESRLNYHIVLIAMTNRARKEINKIISRAYTDGFYYKPRIDLHDLLSLTPSETIITTACIATRLFKGDDWESTFYKPLKEHFKDNFYLEVQCHNHPAQIELNKKIMNLHYKDGIKIIHGCDSHYIYPEDAEIRSLFLKAKGMNYGDEDSFLLDYPSYEEILNRYSDQGVLTEGEAMEALDNTLIFDKAEPIELDYNIKIPKIFKGDSNKHLKKILLEEFKNKILTQNFDEDTIKEYKKALNYEFKIIRDCNMSDYFLLDYYIVKKAVNDYDAVLTRTGRGCFTADALVHTDSTMKPINEVNVGDKVIDMNGNFKKVLNTMKYEIEEDMVKIESLYGIVKGNPNLCTMDHKILIKNNDVVEWVEARKLKKGDLLCVPKLNNEVAHEDYIDLNKYNIFNYKYDDQYIYEFSPYINNKYKYSPTDIANNIGVGKSIIEDIANGKKDAFIRKKEKMKDFMDYIPFNSIDEYRQFIKEKRTRKIKRFIKNDYTMGVFIGMMYGDGTCRFSQDRREVSLAINTDNRKNLINKQCFTEVANRLGLEVYEYKVKNKKLATLKMNSILFSYFISKELFDSKKDKSKQFNKKFFYESLEVKRGIREGLFITDGSVERNRESFDNTSISLINAYKILSLDIGYGINSLSIRDSHIDNRGYRMKKSYKLRHNNSMFSSVKISERCYQDDKYYYLPVKKIELLKDVKTTVYDLEIEESHSYLINNMIVHNSAVSFLINYLLGFTQIDRLKSPIKLYPTRFMSAERILLTKSLPDIDLNWKNVDPVIQASKDYLGEDGIYYMISFKPLKESSAFRLWCKAKGMNINEYNTIAKDLDNYVDDPKWKKLIDDSKAFYGVIESVSPSPCSFLLLDKPISEEVGLIKVGDITCCMIDGINCDHFKYLKNDYLTVSVYTLISETYKLIGRPIDDISTLLKNCDEKVWSLLKNGITTTINQCDSDYDKQILKKYCPTSIAELSAYVASIRPGFKSLLNNFINRLPYTTGVKKLDHLLSDSYSYLLYQESLMTYFTWLGIEEKETYDIIKKISKKKFKEQELRELKEKLIIGWKKQVGEEKGFKETWEVVQDAAKYSFNASHSLSVALDALYGAYLKSNYPMEYFTVALTEYSDDELRTNNLIDELDYFGIKIETIKFRYSNDKYMMEKSTKTIYKGLMSIKYLSKKICKELYEIRDENFDSFVDLLLRLENTSINSRQLDILIKLNFFSEFGEINKLLKQVELYTKLKGRKSLKKDRLESFDLLEEDVRKCSGKETEKQFSNLDWLKLLNLQLDRIEYQKTTYKDRIKYELEHLGYIDIIEPNEKHNVYFVENIKRTKKLSHIVLYEVYSGKIRSVKAWNKTLDNNPFDKGEFITIYSLESKVKKVPSNKINEKTGKTIWINDPEKKKEYWLSKYSVDNSEEIKFD